jgi:hypothetical protein
MVAKAAMIPEAVMIPKATVIGKVCVAAKAIVMAKITQGSGAAGQCALVIPSTPSATTVVPATATTTISKASF